MFRFSANLNTMFQEVSFLDRFSAAEKAGFKYVEIQRPFEFEAEQLQAVKGTLDVNMINLYSDKFQYGSAAIPFQEYDFIRSTSRIFPYYDALSFKKLHLMSGIFSPQFTLEEHENQLVNNLKSLVEYDYLENRNLTGLIEPICEEAIAGYFLDNYETAIDVINAVGSDQVKMLVDIYHLHKITGGVRENLEDYYPYAGHIQISQEPGRCEPFKAGGEIDYEWVFQFLEDKKHLDIIGLEYVPSGSTLDSLDWIKKYST